VSQEWWDREVVLKGQDHNPDPERNKPQSDAEIVDVCHCLSQDKLCARKASYWWWCCGIGKLVGVGGYSKPLS